MKYYSLGSALCDSHSNTDSGQLTQSIYSTKQKKKTPKLISIKYTQSQKCGKKNGMKKVRQKLRALIFCSESKHCQDKQTQRLKMNIFKGRRTKSQRTKISQVVLTIGKLIFQFNNNIFNGADILQLLLPIRKILNDPKHHFKQELKGLSL